uniref:Uncharacterized protein n=1 Tax=Lepeophtheirus salmonis TaxID=72036 RepID=A0A0K2T1H4_LEPSM
MTGSKMEAMSEKQLRTDLTENVHKKLSEFLEYKINFSKRVTDYEKAIQEWNKTMTAFVSKITFNLYSKVEGLHQSLNEVQGKFQDLVKINRILEDKDNQPISLMKELTFKLSTISYHVPKELEHFPMSLSPEGEIESIRFEESIVSGKELNLLRALSFDQNDRKSFLPPFESSALHPEDSFYSLEKKHLGVHVYDGNNGTILKTHNPNPLIAHSAYKDDNKGSCSECGQPVSVLLQLQMSQKKVTPCPTINEKHHVKFTMDEKNNNDIQLSPLGMDVKSGCPSSAGGSAKKIVSFQPKTIILEENFIEEGYSTPKVREGVIRLDDDYDVNAEHDKSSSTRTSFAPSSPPLKEDNIIHSASKSFQRRLSRGEFSDDGKTAEERENPFSDVIKSNCLFGLNKVLLTDTYDVKSQVMYPVMISKLKNYLYVGSPNLKKVCVFDISTKKGQGFLKLPDSKAFSAPRNLLLYGRDIIMVLDEQALYLFHNGVLLKSLFSEYAKNFRGLSLDRSGNESQQTLVYTLEKIQPEDSVSIVTLDIMNETILKRVLINGTNGSEICCRFLSVASEVAIVSDKGSGKMFKVDLSKNISSEVERPSFVKSITCTTGVEFHSLLNLFIVATTNGTLEIMDTEGAWIKTMPFPGEKVAGIYLDGDDLYSAEMLNMVKKYALL